jgi:iron complex transport system ATP-binding protein
LTAGDRACSVRGALGHQGGSQYSEVRSNPALSRNGEAPSGDESGKRIVTDVSLAAENGRFTGLLGPNGSGKSTILKTIYRVHKPAAGRIRLDGAELLTLSAREAARRIAVVAQETTSEFDFSVREMVMIGRTPCKRAFGADTEADHAAVEQAIGRVGCGHLTSRSFNTLSGGEKQLVLVARALAQGADYLILDEPTNHLDDRHQVEILEVVAGLGVAVLAALHDLSRGRHGDRPVAAPIGVRPPRRRLLTPMACGGAAAR